MPHSRKACPNCGGAIREIPERKIPIVTALIALAFFSVIVFGASSVIIGNIRRAANERDTGLHLDGTWEIEAPTYNDEHIVYVFAGDAFTSRVETMALNISLEDLNNIREFHRTMSGASVEAVYMDNNNYLLRIRTDGTFILDGYTIMLITGEGFVRMFSFYWEDEAIVINGDRFLRQ